MSKRWLPRSLVIGLIVVLGALITATSPRGLLPIAHAQPRGSADLTTQPEATLPAAAQTAARPGPWRPETIWEFWGVVIMWGLLVILLLVVGYKVFDWLTPKIDFNEKLNAGNIAVAIVIAAFLIAAAIVIHAVVSLQ